MVRIKSQHYGRGAAEAKIYLCDNFLFCVLKGGMTPVERNLLEHGDAALVRHRLQGHPARAESGGMSSPTSTAARCRRLGSPRRARGYALRMPRLVVIGYDGSHDADLAVDFAAAKLGAETARVVTGWETGLAAAEVAPALGAPRPPSPEEEARFEEAARQTADSGVERAVAAGLSAEPEIVRGSGVGEIARALLDVAEQHDADLVVVGRRGMGRIRSVVLGSVSDAVVRDGRRPVLVVPGPTD